RGTGGGKKTPPPPSSSPSFALVLLNSTDGLPHAGQNVTFSITTTATAYPWVSLTCVQSSTTVLTASAGFWDGVIWPENQIMSLASMAWTSGAADCTAKLTAFNSGIVLGAFGFPAYLY